MFKSIFLSISIVFVLLLLVGCNPEPVEFKKITNVKVVSNNGQILLVTADALLYNPNKSRGQVTDLDIQVSYKNKEVAHIQEVGAVKVLAQDDFILPLEMDLDLTKLQDNWLGSLITILSDKSVELHFKGKIKIKIHGISRTIPVDYTEKLKL